jgi:hypothetical protein
MKIAVLLSAVFAFAAADVSVFTEKACAGTRSVQVTKMGVCANIAESPSAKGCAFPYTLRLHKERDCADQWVKQCPNTQCCGLGGDIIRSVKCVRLA